jgi:hypothetical protein
MRLPIGKFPLRLCWSWLWNCRRDRIASLRYLARHSLLRRRWPELHSTLLFRRRLVSCDLEVRVLTRGLQDRRIIDLDRLALLEVDAPEANTLFYPTISFTTYPLNLRHCFLLGWKKRGPFSPLRFRESYAMGFANCTRTIASPAVVPPEVPINTSVGAVKGIASAANGNVCTLPTATAMPVAISPVPPIFVDRVPTPNTGVPPLKAVIVLVRMLIRTLP